MDLHGSAAGVSEHVGDALTLESFDENVGAFSWLGGDETGDVLVIGGGYGGRWCGQRVGEGG